MILLQEAMAAPYFIGLMLIVVVVVVLLLIFFLLTRGKAEPPSEDEANGEKDKGNLPVSSIVIFLAILALLTAFGNWLCNLHFD